MKKTRRSEVETQYKESDSDCRHTSGRVTINKLAKLVKGMK